MHGLKHARFICPTLVAAVLAAGLLATPHRALSQSGSNPTAQAVTEKQLLDERSRIEGRITIPDDKAAILQQPQGRTYQSFHEGALPWIGAVAVIGMLVLLAVFFLYRGRIRTQAPESGIKIARFNALERFTHWLTATAFVVLAITGLNYVFGKRLLMPLVGPEGFSAWTHWAKVAHTAIAWVFMAGVLTMLALWIRGNLPDRHDWPWLKAGGGMFARNNDVHPPAGRFNAGQKLIFWAVVLGGAALSASGILLLFPFSLLDVNGMQAAQYLHATAGMAMIAVILAHIYIGTLGMEGAFQAMSEGDVDLTWAKEHHSVWVEEDRVGAKGSPRRRAPPRPSATPAE